MGNFNKTLSLQLFEFCQVLRDHLLDFFTFIANGETREEKVQIQHCNDKLY